MGILNYINEKKAKLKEIQTSRRISNLQSQETKLKELDRERLRLADEVRLNNAINQRQESVKALRKQKLASSMPGRIVSNIQSKIKASKNNNSNIFTSGNNIFTKQSSGNIFTQGLAEPISKPKKKKVIIYE